MLRTLCFGILVKAVLDAMNQPWHLLVRIIELLQLLCPFSFSYPIFFIILTLSKGPLLAQEVWLVQSPVNDFEFQDFEIRDIIQDRKGFIWLATPNGLVKYDGNHFSVTQYDQSIKNGLKHNLVTSLIEEVSENTIWVSTFGGGVHKYHNRLGKIEGLPARLKDTDVISMNCMVDNDEGFLWIGTNSSLLRLNKSTLQLDQINREPGNELWPSIQVIRLVALGKIWVGTTKGMYEVDTRTNMVTPIPLTANKSVSDILSNDGNIRIVSLKNEILLYGKSENGDPLRFAYSGYPFSTIKTIAEVSKDHFLFGTDKGLWKWKLGSASLQPIILYDPLKKQTEFFDINCFLRDRIGNWWIGTKYSGLKQLLPESFNSLPQRFAPSVALRDPTVTTIYQSGEQLLWIGTLKGLQIYDQKSQKEILTRANPALPLFQQRITFVFKDSRSHLWIGVQGGGYYRIKSVDEFIKQGKLEQFDLTDMEGRKHPVNSAMRMLEDKHGNLWIGSFHNGIHIRRPKFNDVVILEQLSGSDDKGNKGSLISSIVKDKAGNIWVGTYDAGLFKYLSPDSELPTSNFQQFSSAPGNSNSLSHEVVLSVYPDSKGIIWVGTFSGGLNRFDPSTNTWKSFTKKDGLPNQKVYSIVPDDEENLWLATDMGLSNYRVAENRFINYSERNGIPFNRHYFFSSFRNSGTGELFFGGVNGLYFFHPEKLNSADSAPFCRLVALKLFNEVVQPSPKGVLQEDISYASSIRLKHHQDVIEFQLSALSFKYPEQNKYAYQLVGFDPDWNFIGNKNEVTYTNLDPGDYTFRFKAADYRGIWGEVSELNISVLPPPWATWWAYSLYALVLIGLVHSLYSFTLRRRLEEAESLRLKELDSFKTRFYTNITHEFRTPLTVINGMAEQVKNNPAEWFNEGLRLIKRNSNQLLQLVNQMLELSKLESGKLPLQLRQGDVVNYIRYLMESFETFAESRGVKIHFLSDFDNLMMDYDAVKLEQVIMNLLSNAVKFSPEGGHVYVSIREHKSLQKNSSIVITVRDTGIGISEDNLPFIFDRFYQVDHNNLGPTESTGIGLAMVKELVKLMGGEIRVTSQPGKGSEFRVKFPVRNEAQQEQQTVWGQIERPYHVVGEPTKLPLETFLKNDVSAGGQSKSLVLIAEDNPDVVAYLAACLADNYKIAVAKDGQECCDIAVNIIPDIIITDVMMPHKDGLEVCKQLKEDERTSHVPIIMLTAKADIDSRLAGLERGADAYLSKPFHKQELLVEIKKLLDLRKKLQLHYRSLAGIEQNETPENKILTEPAIEDFFVMRAKRVVEAHLDDYDFTVEGMCREMRISNAHLHRKLSALTGLSANKFIRRIRLNHAKTLLINPDITISSVAFDSGFNDPSYFGRVFKQEFGITPNEFRLRNPDLSKVG